MAKPKVVKEVKKQEDPGEVSKEEIKPKVVKEVESPVLPGGLRRVKVSQDELMKLQDDKKLVGYDPATQEAIIR